MVRKFKLTADNSSGTQRLYIDPSAPEDEPDKVAITLVGDYKGEDIQIDFDPIPKDALVTSLKLLLSDLQ